ncbi:hypothetical protein BSKO_02721 [Bryopsis sp. KO-2023]|nr:hypothetical protein BSKO_02721 [Bryopsis sp. KO-2023]
MVNCSQPSDSFYARNMYLPSRSPGLPHRQTQDSRNEYLGAEHQLADFRGDGLLCDLDGNVLSPSIGLEKLVTKRKKVFQGSVAFTNPPEQPEEENSSEAMHSNGRFPYTNKENDQFWRIDLGATYDITKIVITSGGGKTCSVGLQDFDIRIGSNSVAKMNGACVLDKKEGHLETKIFLCPMVGRHVNVQVLNTKQSAVCEVMVYAWGAGCKPPESES